MLNLTGKGALNASKKPGKDRGRQTAEFHATDGSPAAFFANILCRHHGLEGSERDAVLAACFLNSIGCSAYVTEAVMKFGGVVPAVETIVRCVNALREKSSGRTFPDDYTKAEVVALLSDVIEKQRRLLLMEFKTSMTSMNMAA